MSDKQKFSGALARTVAGNLAAWLVPNCEPDHVAICGSIRRGKPEVGDAEILYVSKIGLVQKPGEMFGSHGSLAEMTIDEMIQQRKLAKRPNVNGATTWGPQNKLAVHVATGLPVDLFATTKDNWFVSLVIRTGPKEFNIALIESARKRGLQLHAYGTYTEIGTGDTIIPKSELEVLELAGFAWIEPEDRQ